jgi:hypothetical protein
MQQSDHLSPLLTAPGASTLVDLVRRLAIAGLLLAALTLFASVALTIQN